MPHFVRCIEGHVFDAELSPQCPTCGAIVDIPPKAPIAPIHPLTAAGVSPSIANVDEPALATIAPRAAAGTSSAQHMLLFAAIAALTLAGGAGALLYALHRRAAPQAITAANSMVKGPDNAASGGSSTTQHATAALPLPPPASLAQTLATTHGASTTPAPASLARAQPSQPPSSSVTANISATLKTTLDLMRTFVAFRAKQYSDVLSMAEPLISRGNPIAMYFKAGILTNGLAGERDPVQARALLRDAAQRGDPTSLLFMARFLEKGIGGPQDMDTAKRLYLLAAQGMANRADQDVTRLGLSGDVGLTALQAYQTVGTANAAPQAMQEAASVLWNLAHQGLTPAVCLSAQLMSLAKARGWNVAKLNTGAEVQGEQREALQLSSFRYGAPRGDPWCEWGMGKFASTGGPNYPKNLVEADVFYRLAVLNSRLGADAKQVKEQLAAVESQMRPEEKAQADGLFHSAIPASMAP
jgi:TPR repeat protein